MNELVTAGQASDALALPDADKMLILFQTENGFDPLIDRMRNQARAEAKNHDPETAKGREALKSLAYKVSKTLREIERQGHAATETLRKQVAAANAGKTAAMLALAELRDEIKRPAIEFEEREEARIEAHKVRLASLAVPAEILSMTSDQIEADIDRVEAISIATGWEEFQADAAIAKDSTLTALRGALQAALKREAEAAELEELRRERAAKAEAEAKRIEEEAEKERLRKSEEERLAKLAQFAAKAREYIAALADDETRSFSVLIHLLAEEIVPKIDALGDHAEGLHQLRLLTLDKVKGRAEAHERAQREAPGTARGRREGPQGSRGEGCC